MADYTNLLRTFLGFYLPYEEKLERMSSKIPLTLELNQRKKVLLLVADVGDRELDKNEHCKNLPNLSSWQEAVRALYVTEGSTLGGQLISKHLREQLAIKPDQLNFFGGYGKATGAMWQRFRTVVGQLKAPDHDAVLAGAKDTFSCLQAWLTLERA